MPRGKAPKKVDQDKRKRVQKTAKESRQRLVNQFREDTRDKFFKGNENISDDRLDRRRQQDLAEQRFIRTRMKPVEGSSNLLQKRDPEGIDLAEFRRRNAMQYGPTLSEIGSDIGFGIGSIAKGFAEKGTPMIQLFKGLSDKFKGGVKDAYDNLRNVFKGESQFTSQASKGPDINQPTQSQIVRELIEKSKNDSAFIPPTFDDQKIEVQQLPALLPPSQQGDATFRNDYPFLYDSRLDNLPFKAVPNNTNDQTNFQKALANARVENTGLGLDSLKAAYDFARKRL